MELNREHFRAIIYYNFQRQLSQQECLAELLSVFGNEAPHHFDNSTISRWYGEFQRGRVSLSGDPRVGNVDAVRKLIIEDRHVTYREIEASLKISKTSIQKILHEELGVRKLVSRLIPQLLTEEQKAARVNWCQKRLTCYEPENKQQSAVWVFQGEEKPTKQRTVTADWYTTIYNASSHTAQKTRQYLTEQNLPNLSPNHFFTFPKIKNRLHEEAGLPANEWNECFENWFERMQMCINLLNRHNCRYWSDSNPRIYHEVHTQQPQKLNVWADAIDPALTAIIENQNDRRYIANRLMFQQDYVSLLDFFMWGHLKIKIYATQPTSLEDLRQRIVNEYGKKWVIVTFHFHEWSFN
ncbi:unnamed protein product [Acanthoscelides obtectus]|uniref:Mos1 transposase HTH domain-containing protein n=1 Tax=Acanthoscelides obtectus TaxID=200917 RepID=A0A9P0PM48_ACAOB|nr:unnamed protein product [Acanthoscelides obtectus]CAK1626132.1 Histone-lysine N-methyltransferase SETMAR [Acanthoscelides obtectus]